MIGMPGGRHFGLGNGKNNISRMTVHRLEHGGNSFNHQWIFTRFAYNPNLWLLLA